MWTQRGAGRTGAPRDGQQVEEALAGLGFEPERAPDRLLLANCPFHVLARQHTALACGLNHAFLTGLVDGLDVPGVSRLAPRPGRCCVELADR